MTTTSPPNVFARIADLEATNAALVKENRDYSLATNVYGMKVTTEELVTSFFDAQKLRPKCADLEATVARLRAALEAALARHIDAMAAESSEHPWREYAHSIAISELKRVKDEALATPLPAKGEDGLGAPVRKWEDTFSAETVVMKSLIPAKGEVEDAVAWMAFPSKSNDLFARVFAHTEFRARELGDECYGPEPFEVVPLFAARAAGLAPKGGQS